METSEMIYRVRKDYELLVGSRSAAAALVAAAAEAGYNFGDRPTVVGWFVFDLDA